MFIDFDKAFNENDTNHIPIEVIKVLTDKLPEGFTYDILDGEVLALKPTTEGIKLDGLKIDTTDPIFEGFVPKDIIEAVEYLYRSQKKLKVKLNGEDELLINGKNFKVSNIIMNPLNENIEGKHEISIIPPPFEPPSELELETENVTQKFMVQRVPLAHMYKIKFESIDEGSFKISFIIDEKNKSFKFNYKIQFDKVISTLDMLNALKLYYGCLTNNFKINGHKVNAKKFNEKEAQSVLKNIALWEKIAVLEIKLNAKFNPDIGLDQEDVLIIEKLYRSLIENKPFKEFVSLNDFSMANLESNEQLQDILGKEGIVFNLTQTAEINLLGAKLKLYMLTYLFDLIVIDFVKDNDVIKLLTIPSKGKKIYQSVKFYLNKSDLEIYNKVIPIFQDAEEIEF